MPTVDAFGEEDSLKSRDEAASAAAVMKWRRLLPAADGGDDGDGGDGG